MPRETTDPDQVEVASYFADDPAAAAAMEPKDVVVRQGEPEPEPKPAPRQPEPRQEARREPIPETVRRAPQPRVDAPRQDDAAAEFRRQLDLQRQATVRAEAAAREAMLRASQAEHGRSVANVAMLDSAIDSAVRASAQAKARAQAAFDLGDHKIGMDATEEMQAAQANLLRLQEQKAVLEEDWRAQQQQRQQPQPQPQPQQQPFDPNRAMAGIAQQLAQGGYVRSVAWLRNHPELVSSPQMIDRLDAAHRSAVNLRELPIESDAYFDHLERELGMTRQPPPAYGRGVGARAAAPVTNAAPSLRSGQTRSVQVHLTREQRDHAHNVLGMDDEEYARELLRSQDEGKLLGVRS